MRFSLTGAVLAASSLLSGITSAQQYQGEVIPNSLPTVLNSEITYFKIKDPRTTSKTPANLTLINYMSLNTSSKRPQDFKKIQRAVIVVHGLNRDPGTYEANMLSALSQVEKSAGLTTDNVAIMAPYFAGGADKNYGFPWDDTNGSTSSALVWYASQWSAGAINQYPSGRRTAGSFDVMDQVVQWFGNKTVFPNLKQIVVSGHSLGAQFVQRYAMVGKTATQLGISTPIAYWIGDPNSMVWPSLDRPLSTNSCPTYDEYREGFTDYLLYGGDVGPKRNMTYNLDLVDAGRPAILSNFQSKQIHWARALQDFGDQSDDCDAETTGKDRNERFFNFIKQFPVSCDNPAGGNCDTVDFVNAGHDGGALFASPAGRARLFLDNFDGTGKRAYDFGYPRIASYDDPYPDPSQSSQALIGTDNTAYSGGYTYQGCFSDQDTVQSIKTIRNNSYTGSLNTREYCISVCASGGYSIAGVENGNQCYCGNAVSSETAQVAETECSNSIIAVKCAGNSNQYCGGSNRIALFATGNITHSAPVKNPDTIGNYTNQGCYTEGANGVRALNGAGTTSNKMTMEYCANYCSAYKWFGVEYAQECYCANTLATTANKTADGECNMQCPGSDSEFCGAGNRLNVYMNPNWVAGSTGGGNTGGGNTGSGTTGPACPGSNNTVYTSNGKNFTVECGIDHSGGDLTSLSAQSLGACLDACAQNDKCVDVSLSGTACYLKSSLGKAVSAPGIVGGFLSSAASPSSTSSGSSTTPTGSATGSTTSTGTTTSTSAIATSSSISCPASNNTIYTSNSKNFTVECGIDHQGGDLTSLSASSLAACIDACAQNDKCVDVSLSGSACYLKSSLGKAISAPGVFGGYLNTAATSSTASSTVSATASSSSSSSATGTSTGTSTSGSSSSSSTASSSSSSTSASATPSAVSCPASNNTVYTAKSGQTFLIECDTDHQGGDIASQGVASFADCINACDANTKCVDVSLSGGACYLKGTLGAALKANGIWGAKLVTQTTSSSTISSTLSTSSASSSTDSSATSSSTTSSSTVSTTSSASATSSTTTDSASSTASTTSSSATDSTSSTTSSATSTTSSSSSDSTTSTTTSSITSPTPTTLSTSTLTSSTSSSSSSTSSSSSAAALPSGFSSYGCFTDGSTRTLPKNNGSSSTNTPQQCALNCRSQGYKYSGTEYGSECWCGNDAPTTSAASTDCNMKCSGDSSQVCGAGNRLSVVVDNTWKQTFFARSSFSTWNLMGCYVDGSPRTLANGVSLSAYGGANNATVSNALSACQAAGYTYCGVEYYSEVYGSKTAPSAAIASPASNPLTAGCNFPCKGNSTEACGGGNRILVYINNGTTSA